MVNVATTGTGVERDTGRSLLEAARDLAPKIEASASRIERERKCNVTKPAERSQPLRRVATGVSRDDYK